jgi:hypothetical protein
MSASVSSCFIYVKAPPSRVREAREGGVVRHNMAVLAAA